MSRFFFILSRKLLVDRCWWLCDLCFFYIYHVELCTESSNGFRLLITIYIMLVVTYLISLERRWEKGRCDRLVDHAPLHRLFGFVYSCGGSFLLISSNQIVKWPYRIQIASQEPNCFLHGLAGGARTTEVSKVPGTARDLERIRTISMKNALLLIRQQSIAVYSKLSCKSHVIWNKVHIFPPDVI